jgi:hypothetical protein
LGLDKSLKVCYNKDTKRKELIKMLELICRIPDHIGWMITGAMMMLTLVGCIHFGKFIYRVIREWQEAEAEEEEE